MPERILVVGPSWVGDMVMSQVLYKLLRKRDPEAEIDVLAPTAALPLVSRMAEVNRGIKFQLAHGELGLGKRFAFGERLKANHYSRAIVLPNSLKSALVPFAADIPIRTGFRGEYRYYLINDMRLLNKRTLPRMIDRFAALGVREGQNIPALENPSLNIDQANLELLRNKLALSDPRPILGLCPGAEFGDAKKWPAAHYGQLAERAIQAGMQVWIFGGGNDQPTAAEILSSLDASNQPHCVDLTGKTSLLDAVDLISACDQVVSNDSGLMHIAAAVGCHTTVVYGSTSPDFTPPLTEKLSIESLSLDCSPCFKRTCPLGHKNCLNQLTADRIKLMNITS